MQLSIGPKRRRPVPTDDFVQEPELQLAEAGAAELVVEEDRPQALVLHLLLE